MQPGTCTEPTSSLSVNKRLLPGFSRCAIGVPVARYRPCSMTLNGWRIRWIGCGSGSEMSSSVIAAPPIEDAPGRLERMASTAAGGCPRLAAPVPPRVLEQAGRPPGAISVSCQAEHQLAAVPVPGQAERRAGAVRAGQEAAPDERASYRLAAVASWRRRGRSVTLLPARCCRASSRSTPGRPREYVSHVP